jgi:hypothetical protein
MTQTTQFTPSASVTIGKISHTEANNFAMPAVDGGNTDLTVQNTGGAGLTISFAANVPVRAGMVGGIYVPGGVTILITGNATTLAAAAANPLVTSAQSALAASATTVSIRADAVSAGAIISRGTAISHPTF